MLGRGVGGYVAWSFPIMYRKVIRFYRTSPYVLDEHWAFELAPGALWIFQQTGRSLTFTLTASAGLW